MTYDIFPHGKMLVVERMVEEKIGKIHLADNTTKTPQLGTVLKVGPGVSQYKAGDRLVWNKYDGVEVEIGLDKFFLIKEDSIIASYEKRDAGESAE